MNNKLNTNKIAGIGIFTALYCILSAIIKYHIPFEIKIVKNLVVFGIDFLTMIIGLFIYKKINKDGF